MLQFSSAAKIAGLDVLTYVPRHLRPPVVARDQFKCFETTWVACDVGVMMLRDDPSAKLAVLRNVNLSSKHHQPFRLQPLCTPHRPSTSIPSKFARGPCYRLLLFVVFLSTSNVF